MDLTKLYKTQISLTEWFEKSGHRLTEELRVEDNEKRERLKILNEITGLPFDRPVQFKAQDIVDKTTEFLDYVAAEGDKLCALRLIPLEPSLPKLRMRGHSVKDALTWFYEQKIDAKLYKADFVPHSEKSLWSTIFVVNKHGIYGEISRGGHHQLTQGFFDVGKPISFSFNFKEWNCSEQDTAVMEQLQKIVNHIHITDIEQQKKIIEKLQSTFAEDYLEGYFESVTTEDQGLWFVDYNRILGKLYEDYSINLEKREQTPNELKGMIGSRGVFTGKVKIITDLKYGKTVNPGEILICEMTTPEYISLMKNAGAIVTDLGGMLSHAAIIAREFKLPCIVGTGKATKTFQDGDLVEVDAEKGFLRKIN